MIIIFIYFHITFVVEITVPVISKTTDKNKLSALLAFSSDLLLFYFFDFATIIFY